MSMIPKVSMDNHHPDLHPAATQSPESTTPIFSAVSDIYTADLIGKDIKAVTIVSSADELLDIKKEDWSDREIRLVGEPGAIWRGTKRKDINIFGAKNLIIDGGDSGVTIYGNRLTLERCENVTLRNLTIRLGSAGFGKGDATETLSLFKCDNVNIEHCSFSWGTDETVSGDSCNDVKISHCIISEPLEKPKTDDGDNIHPEGGKHAYGSLWRGCKDIHFEQCLFARCDKRNPSMASKGKYAPNTKVESCVIFDWGEQGTKYNGNSWSGHNDGDKAGKAEFKIYANHYIGSKDSGPAILIEKPPKEIKLTVKTRGNVDGEGKKVKVTRESKKGTKLKKKKERDDYPTVEEILSRVGPQGDYKTPVDQRIIDSVKDRHFQGPLEDETKAPEFEERYKDVIKP